MRRVEPTSMATPDAYAPARHEAMARQRAGRPRAIGGASFAASFAFHAALAFAAVTWSLSRETGAVAIPTDAISVEVVATNVLDALDDPSEHAAAATSMAMPEGAVSEVDQSPDPIETKQPDGAAHETSADDIPLLAAQALGTSPAEAATPIAGAAEPDSAPALNRATEFIKPSRPDRTPQQHKPSPQSGKKPVADTKQKPKGGPASQSAAGASGSSGRVSASRGDILSYAARVRSRVASRRPSGNGVRGTVVISFSVTRTGGLGSARVASSSGNSALDREAVSAVRGAGPFGAPPGDAGPLSFLVPFHYR